MTSKNVECEAIEQEAFEKNDEGVTELERKLVQVVISRLDEGIREFCDRLREKFSPAFAQEVIQSKLRDMEAREKKISSSSSEESDGWEEGVPGIWKEGTNGSNTPSLPEDHSGDE